MITMKTRKVIKILLFLLLAIFLKSKISAQNFKSLDKSPHDISYYRLNKVTSPIVKVVYGRPQSNNKEIFGNEVFYGRIWRTGADEATEVKFYKNVLFGNIKVPAGTYVLYTIPGEKEWKVILNSNVDVWNAQYDPLFDIAKITVPSSKAEFLKVFSIAFKEKKDIIQMVLGWGSTRIKIPICLEDSKLYAKL